MTTEVRFLSANSIMQNFVDKDIVLLSQFFSFEERSKMETVARAFANTTKKTDQIRSDVQAAINSRLSLFEAPDDQSLIDRLSRVLTQIAVAQQAKL